MAGLFDEGDRRGRGQAGRAGNLLEAKVGGVPVILIALGGVVVVWFFLSRKATGAASTPTSVTPGATGSLTPQQYAQEYAAAGGTPTAAAAWYNDNASPYGGSMTTTPGPLPSPTLQAISPATGPATGGGTAVITGANFTGTTSVLFGGVPASFAVANSKTIFATIPADVHASGGDTVEITVVNGTGSQTGLSFRYATTPKATAATPAPVTTATAPVASPPPPATAGYGVVTTSQGQMIWLGTVTGPQTVTGFDVGGGAPIYYGNAQNLSTGPPSSFPADYYTPVAYAGLVSKTPTASHEHV
jgi:IPT/TIG domain